MARTMPVATMAMAAVAVVFCPMTMPAMRMASMSSALVVRIVGTSTAGGR